MFPSPIRLPHCSRGGWSEPFFETLIIPLDLRTRLVGQKDKDAQLKLWDEFDALTTALGSTSATRLRYFDTAAAGHV